MACCSLDANIVVGQEYPTRPIRIVTAAAGGGVDTAARLIAQGLTARMGEQVIVENRGGSGAIAAEIVARAPADGHSLILYGSALWLTPYLQQQASYDPVRDFAPITLAITSPNVFVVHPSFTASSVKELIAIAKARPGELNYASTGTGSSPHLAGELFKFMAGVNIVHINYKAAAQAISELIAGQNQLAIATAASATPHVKSGRLRAMAVTTAQPSALFPGIPSVAASGLPGYEAPSLFALFAPTKTPERIIQRLNQEVVRVLALADVKEKFFITGVETVGSAPAELGATVKSEMARMGKLIRDVGIRAE
jgi:tripartite-type tricarboxylate transporter receptor subunit TctC